MNDFQHNASSFANGENGDQHFVISHVVQASDGSHEAKARRFLKAQLKTHGPMTAADDALVAQIVAAAAKHL